MSWSTSLRRAPISMVSSRAAPSSITPTAKPSPRPAPAVRPPSTPNGGWPASTPLRSLPPARTDRPPPDDLPAQPMLNRQEPTCLLYTSDAADEEDSVDLGGR